MNKALLSVNIDHIATIRNFRNTFYPDPVHAAFLAQQGGADGITIHLREDYRHIRKRDVKILKETLQIPMNLEIAANNKMINFACKIKPDSCCLVPEKRMELTTESGLDIKKNKEKLTNVIKQLQDNNINVFLFIEPNIDDIEEAYFMCVEGIEIHTGLYSNLFRTDQEKTELDNIKKAIYYCNKKKLIVNAGHGLNYENIKKIIEISGIHTFNIGHSIISDAFFFGLKKSVKKMKNIINNN
ncbi:MAG: pyridoxine 5'-phosphate synthase [Arsenophonus sp.]|nr:MAG: pyridoxine 5'-phosphate synthase [Arsenophonus sp.]